jgi:hypothetical protein
VSTRARHVQHSVYKHAKDADVLRRVGETIRRNVSAFRKDGVIAVGPGYKQVGGWLTRKPAIVVTVVNKKDSVPPEQLLPSKVGGFAVDVRQATPVEKLRAQNPQRYAQLATGQREEYALPESELELDPTSGQPPVPLATGLAEMAGRAPKPEIDYTPAAGVTLDAVEAPMSIVCHASPDAGWPQLKIFFDQIKSSLTVGLYDFTSAHVLQELEKSMSDSGAALTLTLDHPPKNPTADQPDEETVADLEGSLGGKFQSAWALVRSSPKAGDWIYPTAYHIKVAVRDSADADDCAMWLSSGNWNNSNQPDIDPLQDPAGSADVAKNSDRDWHVIVSHQGLAQTYEAFLKHDFQVAEAATQAAPEVFAAAAPVAELELSGLAPAISMAGVVPSQYFAPLRIPANGTRNIKIQPILTPDNYYDNVLPLIQNAQTSFYMQTQYIHPSDKAGDQRFADLISAIIALQQSGKDVRIIVSQWQAQGTWLDKLHATGMDLSSVRIQNGVHNKGIVVDSQVVMLGSQNWSGDGVLRNRDASLILFDAEAANYYQSIFLHDWTHMASQSV